LNAPIDPGIVPDPKPDNQEKAMKVALIGSGNMGAGLAKQITKAGHALVIGSRNAAKGEALARATGATFKPSNAADGAEVVIVATGYGDAVAALRAAGDLTGKVVVDITNPMTPDYSGLTIGQTSSAAEEIQKAFPRARVVKAFNTVFAQILAAGPALDGATVPIYFAGDDAAAKATVKALVDSTGFTAVDAGGLKNARYLEPLAGLNMYFGYGAGKGTSIAPQWIGVN
jgi:predicted dinucleotide-binding enzyme